MIEVLLGKLTHVIMVLNKFYDMLFESWKIRDACSLVQSKSKSLRTRGTNSVTLSTIPKAWALGSGTWYCWKSQSLKAREPGSDVQGHKMGVPTPEEREQVHYSSAFLLYLGSQPIGWCPSQWIKVVFLIQFTDSNANLLQTTSQT